MRAILDYTKKVKSNSHISASHPYPLINIISVVVVNTGMPIIRIILLTIKETDEYDEEVSFSTKMLMSYAVRTVNM